MKRISLAILTGALAISTVAVAIDVASAAPRGGIYRGGVNRIGVGRVGVGRVGIGYGRAGLAYRGGWNRYYRPGLRLAAGAALGAAAYYGGSGYDAYASGYDAYASGSYDSSGGNTYILHGNYMSEG